MVMWPKTVVFISHDLLKDCYAHFTINLFVSLLAKFHTCFEDDCLANVNYSTENLYRKCKACSHSILLFQVFLSTLKTVFYFQEV